jgi:hypothetical protein
MLAAVFLASQWHFLANKHAVLAGCSAFWPVNCIFLHKKTRRRAPLSGPSVTNLYSVLPGQEKICDVMVIEMVYSVTSPAYQGLTGLSTTTKSRSLSTRCVRTTWTFPVVDKSGTSCYHLVIKVDEANRLSTSCSNKSDIVCTCAVVNKLMTTSS